MKRAKKREIKSKRKKTKSELKTKANREAILAVKNKILKGKNWADLGPKEKERIDVKIKKKSKFIKRLSKKLMPKVREKEKDRLDARRGKLAEATQQNALAREKEKQYDKGGGVENPKEKDAARKKAERKSNQRKNTNSYKRKNHVTKSA